MKKNLLELILLFVVVLGLPAFSAGKNAKEIPIHDHKMMLVEAIGLISKEYQVYFTFDHELVKDIMVEYDEYGVKRCIAPVPSIANIITAMESIAPETTPAMAPLAAPRAISPATIPANTMTKKLRLISSRVIASAATIPAAMLPT